MHLPLISCHHPEPRRGQSRAPAEIFPGSWLPRVSRTTAPSDFLAAGRQVRRPRTGHKASCMPSRHDIRPWPAGGIPAGSTFKAAVRAVASDSSERCDTIVNGGPGTRGSAGTRAHSSGRTTRDARRQAWISTGSMCVIAEVTPALALLRLLACIGNSSIGGTQDSCLLLG
jgi:hypothetical protein